jgi:FMN-dependent NADH-azoreductase
MSHLLHIDASARGTDSLTRQLSAEYANAWRAQNPVGTVTYRDLAADAPAFVSSEWVAGVFGPTEAQNEGTVAAVQASEALIREVEAADVLLLGVPMYNFGVPATFKAWIDQVVMAGRTFSFTENGPMGLLSGKKALVLRATANDFNDPSYAAMDFHAPYLRSVLGFIGIADVEIITVNGFTAEQVEESMGKARAAIAGRFGEPAIV